jgi:hypothetical protein
MNVKLVLVCLSALVLLPTLLWADDEWKAAHSAVMNNEVAGVVEYIKNGKKPETQEARAFVVFQQAIYIDRAEIAGRAIDLGADPNGGGEDGDFSAIGHAIVSKQTEMVKMLTEKGGDVNGGGLTGKPIFVAVRHKDPESVKILIAAGADINAKDAEGKTPLRHARKALEYIVKAGKTESPEHEIVALLEEAGAGDRGKGSSLNGILQGLVGPAFVLFVLGVVLGPIGFYTLHLSLSTKDWPMTDGKILESKRILASVRRRSHAGQVWKPIIKYSYQVDSEGYEGDRIYYGGGYSSNPTEAIRLNETFPEGADVNVYYHPRKPKRSVLEAGKIKRSTKVFSVLGVYAVIWILIVVVYELFLK